MGQKNMSVVDAGVWLGNPIILGMDESISDWIQDRSSMLSKVYRRNNVSRKYHSEVCMIIGQGMAHHADP